MKVQIKKARDDLFIVEVTFNDGRNHVATTAENDAR